MGSSNSVPPREHVITLHGHITRETQEAMIDRLREAGVRIGLIVWSPPLGFVAEISEEQKNILAADDTVASVIDDEDRTDEEEEEEDLWLHMLSCGLQATRPRSKQVGYRMCVMPGQEISSMPRRPFPALKESPAPVESAVMARLAVAAFGRRLAPDTTDAVTATRFLRSKGLRRIQSIDEVDALAQAAVQMYQASLAWRQAERVDEILEEPPHSPEVEEVFQRYFNPRLLDGLDFHGRPVLFFQPSDLDFDELISHGINEQMLVRRFVRVMEELMPKIMASREPLRGHFAVYDVGRLSIYNTLMALTFWLKLGRTLEAYYPETLGNLLVVNAPMGSGRAFEHFKSYLAPASVHKVSLAVGDAREALSGSMPCKMLPFELLQGEAEAGAPASSSPQMGMPGGRAL